VAKSEFFPSYRKVAKTIRNRILHGDYALKPIPSERHLALELGVNYMTVRRGRCKSSRKMACFSATPMGGKR
jgi:DNA-binding transcriptional regulator YhcF (GntR family)